MKYLLQIRIQLLIIILAAILPRLAAGYFLGNRFQVNERWEYEYETLTQNMLSGKGYVYNYRNYGEYRALLAPGYSFLCYGVYRVFGTSHRLMLFIQIMLMTAHAVIVFLIARMLFRDSFVPLLAGLLAALHPGLIYYSSTMLHQLNLYMPLFYVSILLLCLGYRDGKWLFFILLGISGGLAVLTRATILPVIILGLAIYLVFKRETPLRTRLLQAGAALAILLAINVPWTVRNYRIFDRLVFSQTNKWESFWIGNNPEATGGHWKTDGRTVLGSMPPAMKAELAASDSEITDHEIFRKYSLQYIQHKPLHFINGLLRKGVYFWWFYPHTGMSYPKSYLIAYKIIYSFLLALTLAGIFLCRQRKCWKWEMLFPAILGLGIWGAHSMNFMEMRHRWTIEPVMIIFASFAIATTMKSLFPRLFDEKNERDNAKNRVKP